MPFGGILENILAKDLKTGPLSYLWKESRLYATKRDPGVSPGRSPFYPTGFLIHPDGSNYLVFPGDNKALIRYLLALIADANFAYKRRKKVEAQPKQPGAAKPAQGSGKAPQKPRDSWRHDLDHARGQLLWKLTCAMDLFFGGHPSQTEFERLLQEYVEYRHQAEIDRLSDLYPLLYSNPKLGYTAEQVAQKVAQALRTSEATLTAQDVEFAEDLLILWQQRQTGPLRVRYTDNLRILLRDAPKFGVEIPVAPAKVSIPYSGWKAPAGWHDWHNK